ncbi:MAG: SelL-related redox protein [Fuerstiella sp.]|nr:SelL-related redox protein [Fuerstiella sp.]
MITTVEPSVIEDVNGAESPSSSAPTWMRKVLLAAAAYNLLWGAFAILSPLTIFRWAGFDPLPSYPQLWQCVGMIVGVYGIGYAIAATNPYRHWPIVLVGFLGKVFGPIGFVSAAASGDFPLSMGWTILSNDLIWWIPFALILWNAAVTNQSQSQLLVVPPQRMRLDPFHRFISQLGASLSELSRRRPTLVVLLRHSGCTFCRETLGDLSELREQIEAKGTNIALVHMGTEEPVDLLKKYSLEDVHCFRDPTGQLYEYFGLRIGSFIQLFGPKVWFRGIKAAIAGHGIGALNGNGFLMPGVFLMHDGQVLKGFRHQSAADRPDYVELAQLRQSCELSSTSSECVESLKTWCRLK